MKRLLLMIMIFPQTFLPFIRGNRLSSDLFRAVFESRRELASGGEAINPIFQRETPMNPEFNQKPLFVPGKDCHSIMTEEFGEFTVPVYQNNKRTPIWCNWIIWAGPRKHIIVNIQGFVSSEDCAKNQDAILFQGIASTVDSTVIYACWNKNNHVFATQAVALHVVFMSLSSSIHAGEYFHGTYYTFVDNETIHLKYPSLSTVVPKQFGSNIHHRGTKMPKHGPFLSAKTATTRPIKTSYTGDTKTSLKQLLISRFAPMSLMREFNSTDLLITKLIPTTKSEDARCSDEDTSSKNGGQLHTEMPSTFAVDKDVNIHVKDLSIVSKIPSRTRLFTTLQVKDKSTSIGAQALSLGDAVSVMQDNSRKGSGTSAFNLLSNVFMDSETPKSRSTTNSLVLLSRTISPHFVNVIMKTQKQLFKDKEMQKSPNDSNNDFANATGYSRSFQDRVSTFSKYGRSITDGYVKGVSLGSESFTKWNHIFKTKRKDRQNNLLIKDRRKGRKKKKNHKVEVQKNESLPVFLAYRNFNSKVTPPLRIVKEIQPRPSTVKQGIISSQVPSSPPLLWETETGNESNANSSVVGHEVAKAVEATPALSTIMSPNMPTFEAGHQKDNVGFDFIFNHLEILIGTSLGVIMLVFAAVVILCVVLRKRQVKGNLNFGSRVPAAKDSTAQLEIAGPSHTPTSFDSDPEEHRIFPLEEQATAAGPGPDKPFSTNKVTKVTFEQSACL